MENVAKGIVWLLYCCVLGEYPIPCATNHLPQPLHRSGAPSPCGEGWGEVNRSKMINTNYI